MPGKRATKVTEWASPDIIKEDTICPSTDRELRGKSVGYAVELMKIAAEAGTAIVGLPSGDDPGDLKREEAKKALLIPIAVSQRRRRNMTACI